MKEAHREPLFYYNKCKYTTFLGKKGENFKKIMYLCNC